MDREKAIKLFRRDIECLSHDKCSDCILEEVCDPMKTPPDSEYIEAYGMAIEALSAIEDIKAEIEAKAKEREFYLDAGHPYNGLYEALKIIDKHISGKENE